MVKLCWHVDSIHSGVKTAMWWSKTKTGYLCYPNQTGIKSTTYLSNGVVFVLNSHHLQSRNANEITYIVVSN